MPSVKAFTSNQHGHRYTLRETGGEPMKMAAVETITDLLLEIMEVVTLMLKSLLIRKVIIGAKKREFLLITNQPWPKCSCVSTKTTLI